MQNVCAWSTRGMNQLAECKESSFFTPLIEASYHAHPALSTEEQQWKGWHAVSPAVKFVAMFQTPPPCRFGSICLGLRVLPARPFALPAR